MDSITKQDIECIELKFQNLIKQERNESEIESLPSFNELVMRDDFKSEIIKQ